MRTLPGIPSWFPYITAVFSVDSAYYGSNSSHPLKHNKDQCCYWASIKSMKKYISVGFLRISKSGKPLLETSRMIIKLLPSGRKVINA